MSNQEKANTILEQLGGNKFRVMTGAKNFSFSSEGKPYLQFQIGRNSSRCNWVKIELNEGSDTYTMIFNRLQKFELKELKRHEGVYFEDLRRLFTEYTGMYTSLAG